MCMDLLFGILLVEHSFDFVAVLRSCVHVREIKITSLNSASRPSIPLHLMSKVTRSMCEKFSRFHHRGSLPMLLSCSQKVQLESRPEHKLP